MLTIRKQQMAVMEAHMRRRFQTDLLKRLRRDLRDETSATDDDQLLELIENGVLRAQRYGITIERDVSLYVVLMVLYSPHFEEREDMAWARKILLKPSLNGEAKMRLIYQMLAARQQDQPTS